MPPPLSKPFFLTPKKCLCCACIPTKFKIFTSGSMQLKSIVQLLKQPCKTPPLVLILQRYEMMKLINYHGCQQQEDFARHLANSVLCPQLLQPDAPGLTVAGLVGSSLQPYFSAGPGKDSDSCWRTAPLRAVG